MLCNHKLLSFTHLRKNFRQFPLKIEAAGREDLMYPLKNWESVRIKSLTDQEVTKTTSPLQDLQKVNLKSFTGFQL